MQIFKLNNKVGENEIIYNFSKELLTYLCMWINLFKLSIKHQSYLKSTKVNAI